MMYIIVSNSSNLFLVELEISITNHSYVNYIDYMITLVYTNWVKPIPPHQGCSLWVAKRD